MEPTRIGKLAAHAHGMDFEVPLTVVAHSLLNFQETLVSNGNDQAFLCIPEEKDHPALGEEELIRATRRFLYRNLADHNVGHVVKVTTSRKSQFPTESEYIGTIAERNGEGHGSIRLKLRQVNDFVSPRKPKRAEQIEQSLLPERRRSKTTTLDETRDHHAVIPIDDIQKIEEI